MSSHNLRGDPSVPSVKLWPNPTKFVLDETECIMCMNGFGPKRGFYLGACEHIYHPMYLISLMLAHRCCTLCKAPFYQCLYELSGLKPYMPINWEYDPKHIPSLYHLWGDDLVWSWQLLDHSHNKSNISSQFEWKNDHKEIFKVCQKLVGFGIKERKISSTNASTAIGMRRIWGSNLDNI